MPFSLPLASVSHLYCNVDIRIAIGAACDLFIEGGQRRGLPDAQLALCDGIAERDGYAGGRSERRSRLKRAIVLGGAAVLSTGSGTAQVSHTPAVNLGHSLGFSASSLGSPYLLRAESASAPQNAGTTTLLTNVPPAVFARFS